MNLSRYLSPRVEAAYALLRIGAGLMFAFHGMQKVLGILATSPATFGSQKWIGGVIELVCGLAVALGAYTSWAAFLCSGTMAVAYVQFHWKLQGGADFFPTINKGELALLYALLFLFIACRGAGAFSVERRRQ